MNPALYCGEATLDLWPHPVLAEGRSLHPACPGQRLSEVLADWMPYGLDAVAIVNGTAVMRADWHTVVIGERDVIQARTLLGDAGGSNPVAVVASIALLVALGPGGFLGSQIGALGLGQTATAFASAAVATAGIIAINTLFPPNLPTLDADLGSAPRRQYSLSGGQNLARPYGTRPLLLGTHRVFPDMVAKEYTEYDLESDQYLNQIYDFGPGNFVIEELYLGETPISSYQDVTTQKQVDRITLVKGNVDTLPGGELGHRQDDYQNWIARTTPAKTTRIAFDVAVLHSAQESGDLVGRTTNVIFQYRRQGQSQWTSQELTIPAAPSNRLKEAIRRSYAFDVQAGTYDVRARLNAYYTDEALESPTITIQAQLAQIRALQDDEADFTGYNPVAVRAKASGQLYGRMENLNARVTNTLWQSLSNAGPYDHSNPADVLLFWYRGYRIDGKLILGYGYDDAIIDMNQINAFRVHCRTHGLECNVYADNPGNENQVAEMIARCGWGRIDQSTGKHGVVFEDNNAPMTAIITPDNIIAGSLSIDWENQDLADEIVGEFIDRDSDFQRNELRRYVPNSGTNGEFPVTVFLQGITDGEHAAKEINRMAGAQFYHTRSLTWAMDETGPMAITVGDVVGLGDGLSEEGNRGGRLKSISSDRRTLELLRDDITTPGSIWVWALDDTILATTYTVNADGTLRLASAVPRPPQRVPDDPNAYQYMAFDPTAPITQARIVGMVAEGDGQYKFLARDEVGAYYDARTSDLNHPLIGARPRTWQSPVAGFVVTENELGVRTFTWNAHPFEGVIGYQIRFGSISQFFDAMQPLHEGVLTATVLELMDRPDAGTWRFGIVAVYEDGRASEAAYYGVTLGPVTKGLDGADGQGVEYIFATTADPSLPSAQRPNDAWAYDTPQAAGTLQWYDGAPTGDDAFSAALPYLWRSERRVPGSPAAGDAKQDTWGDWSEPSIEGRWGADGQQGVRGVTGADGTDGVGVEYVFAVTAGASIPNNQRPLNAWPYDSPATVNRLAWHDGAPNLTADKPYLWRSERRVPGSPAAGDAKQDTWGDWSEPSIEGRWGADGQQGVRGVTGADGTDGVGVEYVFAVTAGASIPNNQRPLNAWPYDSPATVNTLAWHDGAPNLTADKPYLWRSERRVPGSPAAGDAKQDTWGDWSVPVVVGRYGQKGDKGDPGDPADLQRGPALYRYRVTAAQQAELEAAGSTLPAAYVTIANDLTTGENVNGDFVSFYRNNNFVQWWTWQASSSTWVRAVDLVAAAEILAVNITAIKGDFGDIDVTGTLAAEHISADVRNWDPLWGGSVSVEHDDDTTATTVTLTWGTALGATTDYDMIGVLIEYTARSRKVIDVALFETSRSALQSFGLFGFGSSPNDFISVPANGMGARSLALNQANSDDVAVTVKGVWGIKNPLTGGTSTSGGNPPPTGTSQRTRTFYQRGTSAPAAPTSTAFSAYISPGGGWSASDPGATSSQDVYQVTLTQTFSHATTQTSSTFTSNSWGAVTLHEEKGGGDPPPFAGVSASISGPSTASACTPSSVIPTICAPGGGGNSVTLTSTTTGNPDRRVWRIGPGGSTIGTGTSLTVGPYVPNTLTFYLIVWRGTLGDDDYATNALNPATHTVTWS